MSWSGSGSFNRAHNWTNDAAAGIPITASRMDAEDDNFATGINACLAKNGENAATNNLNIGGYRLTFVGAGSAATDAATIGGTETLTNKTLTAPVFGGTVTGTYTLGGAPTLTSPTINSPVFGGTVTGAYVLGGAPILTSPTINFAAVFSSEVDNGNSGSACIIDWTVGNKQKSTLTDNATFTFTAPAGPCNLVFKLIQDGTGSRNPVWPASVLWAGGAEPTWSTTAGAIDIVTFYYDGTNYFGAALTGFA